MKLKPLDLDGLSVGRPMARAARSGESWYRLAKKDEDAEVLIYAEIGMWGITADDFVRDLREVDAKTINLHLNSPGGSVFDGLAIYNALVRHDARIVVHIDGWAASIASVIAMAGDEIRIGESGYVMIHKPWSWAMGDAGVLRREADVLDKLEDGIVDIYVARTEGDRKKIQDWVGAETWFNGKEAVEAGFADVLVEAKKKPADPAARLDRAFFAAIFPNLPESVFEALGRGRPAAALPPIRSRQDLRAALLAHGMSRGAVDALTPHYIPPADARDEPEGDPPSPDPRNEAATRALQAAAIHVAAVTLTR